MKREEKGFTLVELLVVITIIASLITIATTYYLTVLNKSKTVLCKNNLRQLHGYLLMYKDRFGVWPKEKGPKFLISLWEKDIMRKNSKNAKLFLCPGVSFEQEDNEEGRAYNDWDTIDSTMCGYACRDAKRYPIIEGKLSKKGNPNYPNLLILSDDSEEPLNHEFKINVLYSDGTIDDVDISIFEEEGFFVGEEALEPEADETGRYLWPDFRVLTEESD